MAKGKKKTVKKAAPAKAKAAKSAKKSVQKNAKKSVAKKAIAKKAVAKKPVAKKSATKKSATKKTAAKKSNSKASSSKTSTLKAAPKAQVKMSQPAKSQATSSPKSTSGKKLDLSDFITPLDDRLIVLPEESAKMTAGGLYIPDTVEDRGANAKGLVVSVGRGHRSPKGYVRPMDVQVGDQVLFAQHAGSEFKIQNYDLLIVREADVLGVVG